MKIKIFQFFALGAIIALHQVDGAASSDDEKEAETSQATHALTSGLNEAAAVNRALTDNAATSRLLPDAGEGSFSAALSAGAPEEGELRRGTRREREGSATPDRVRRRRTNGASGGQSFDGGAAGEVLDQATLTEQLKEAARCGDKHTVKRLLQLGANPNGEWNDGDDEGETPLIVAVENNHFDVVKALLKAGAEVSVRSYDDETALMIAAKKGYSRIVELLIKSTHSDRDLNLALRPAAENGHIEILDTLFRAGAKMIDYCADNIGFTSLLCATMNNQLGAVKKLLELGAAVDCVCKVDDKQTALIEAAGSGYNDIVRVLLDHGANKEIKDWQGRTAIMIAALLGRTSTVQMLLDCGADFRVIDNNGNTAMTLAQKQGHAGIVELLLALDTTNISDLM